MPQVEIPLDLFQQIQAALPTSGGSPDQFVSQAVQEKLDKQDQREEFLRLSDKNREAMIKQGLTEEQVLADFDAWRHSQRSQAQRSPTSSNQVK
jgi:hypothetical protein